MATRRTVRAIALTVLAIDETVTANPLKQKKAIPYTT